METTGDPRLPNKLQADLWAFPDNMSAARKCSISLGRPGRPAFSTNINPFSPELSTELAGVHSVLCNHPLVTCEAVEHLRDAGK